MLNCSLGIVQTLKATNPVSFFFAKSIFMIPDPGVYLEKADESFSRIIPCKLSSSALLMPCGFGETTRDPRVRVNVPRLARTEQVEKCACKTDGQNDDGIQMLF